MASIFIENYGCSANYDDGAIAAGLLVASNHQIVNDLDEADVAIINSCAVKNVTVSKIFTQIENIVKNYHDKKLIITGCMPAAEKDKLAKYLKKGVAFVSTHNITEMPGVVEKVLNNEQVVLTSKGKALKLGLPKIIKDNKIASIQIAHGCLSACGFCSTKLAKGSLISYPKEEIVKEIKKYVSLGFKRINLTGTDNACYGFDLGYNLADLLKEVVNIPGDFTVRVGMGNPEHVREYSSSLIEVFKNPKIMKFIHFPVQSGSDKVLKEMKRKYTVKEFKETISSFRNEIPSIDISTDIIVGYPTETLDDFNETVDLVTDLKFDVLNLSKFASRPGTIASKLKPLKSEEIKRRSGIIYRIYHKQRYGKS